MRSAAAVLAAGVVIAVVMVMMIASCIGVIMKIACDQAFCRLIRVSADPAKESDARIGKCHLRSCSNAAADQRIHLVRRKEVCKRTVTASVGIDHS